MLALRSERVMTFAGPFSPKLTADAFVVSEYVGEGGPGDAFRFAWEFVAIARGRKGRDFRIIERVGSVWVGGSGSGEWGSSLPQRNSAALPR